MKYFPLLLLLLSPVSAWALYVQGCPLGAGCKPSELVWVQIDPFGSVLNPEAVAMVVGGGLLLWGIGCGFGMLLNTMRKMRL